MSDIIWKHKQRIKLCYGVYNETNKDFPICFWFQRMSLSNLLLIWVVVVWFLILRQNDLESLFTLCRWIKNLTAKTTKYISKCWGRSVKWKSNLNFIRATQKIYRLTNIFYIYGPSLSKNYLVMISCSPLRATPH